MAQPQAPLAAPQGPRSWSLEDCEQAAATARPAVGRGSAHRFLSLWRGANQPGTYTDLTDRQQFDWVSYLGQHRDRTVIFDNGLRVDSFGIHSMPWVFDTNTRVARVDFIVRRIGATASAAVRLHPGSKDESKVVIHEEGPAKAKQLEELWHDDIPPTLAVPQGGKGNTKGHDTGFGGDDEGKRKGRGDALRQRKHYRGASAADLIPTKVVEAWVASRVRSAAPGTFTMNVSGMIRDQSFPRDQVFTWFLWFNKVPELSQFVDRVDEIWMVKAWRETDTYDAGFWFNTIDNRRAYFVTFVRKRVVVEDAPRWVDWTL